MSTAKAFNLARRESVRQEPDLLQEDFTETPTSSPYTYKACLAMLDRACPDSPLPAPCKQFEDIKVALQRRNTDPKIHAIAFEGMSPGDTSDAIFARKNGRLSHAQFQRRMTSGWKNLP